MKITVCIGSSCHLKGSRPVVETIKSFVEEKGLQDKIELAGTFCMGNCKAGVCVKIDEEFFSVSPEAARSFCEQEVLKRLKD